MFDIAWSEMLVLIVIAIVVIGPKDLPKVMRSVGGWMRKARALASEFRFSMDELARETELDEIRKNAAAAANFDPNQALKKALDPAGEMDDLLAPPSLDDGLGGPDEPAADQQASTEPSPASESAPAPSPAEEKKS